MPEKDEYISTGEKMAAGKAVISKNIMLTAKSVCICIGDVGHNYNWLLKYSLFR